MLFQHPCLGVKKPCHRERATDPVGPASLTTAVETLCHGATPVQDWSTMVAATINRNDWRQRAPMVEPPPYTSSETGFRITNVNTTKYTTPAVIQHAPMILAARSISYNT